MSDVTQISEDAPQFTICPAEGSLQLIRAQLRYEACNAKVKAKRAALGLEPWAKLIRRVGWDLSDRTRFFRNATQAVRQTMVDHARTFDRSDVSSPEAARYDELLRVDQMLKELQQYDSESARLITLKFFCGLTDKEIAVIEGVSRQTVRRHWDLTEPLLRQVAGDGGSFARA